MIKRFWKWLKLGFDRSFSGSWWRQILWPTAIAVIFIFIGWAILAVQQCDWHIPLWKPAGYFIDSNAFHADFPSDGTAAPLFSLIFSLLGMIFMGGMLISVIVNILTRRVDEYREGNIRYGFSDHILIIGSGDTLVNMIKQIKADPACAKNDIVIHSTTPSEELRRNLHIFLTRKEEKRIVFLYGRRDSAEEMEDLKVWRAKEVFIIGEPHEADHDSLNIDCLELIRKICREKNIAKPLKCNMLVEYQTSFHVFQAARYKQRLKDTADGKEAAFIELHIINIYDNWAQNVLVTGRAGDIEYAPLDREPVTEKYIHFVVFGMTRMGTALATTAAHIAHYPNFRTKGLRTKITFVSPVADREMNFFTSRYHNLFDISRYTYTETDGFGELKTTRYIPPAENDFLDIEWEFIKGSAELPSIRQLIETWSCDGHALLTIAMCGNSSAANVAAALYLPPSVYLNQIPVLVYQKDSGTILNIARETGQYSNLRPFGMASNAYGADNNERIANAQKINYIYNEFFSNGGVVPSKMGDEKTLGKLWNDLSLPLQWSNIYAANSIPTKYRSIGADIKDGGSIRFTDEQVEILAEIEHNRWNMEKLLMGYRMANEQESQSIARDIREKGKDSNLKKEYSDSHFIHYDIRPFDDLRPDNTGKNAADYDKCIVKGFSLIFDKQPEK